MTHASSSPRSRRRHPRGGRRLGRRPRVALLALAAVVLAGLVATAVVVLGGDRPAATPADPTGCSAMTMAVRYQVNPTTRAGLLTTASGPAEAADEAGWTKDQGVLFRAAEGPATGLVAVHQLRLGEGDQLWTSDAAEVREAVQSWGYADQGVVAYVAEVASACTVQVQRFQLGGVHRYATTRARQDALRDDGWAAEGSFYAARPGDAASATPSPTSSGEDDPPGDTVIDARFDEETVGPVTPDSFIRAVGKTNRSDAEYDSMTYEREPQGPSRFVRTHLAAHRILDRNDAPGDGNVLVVPLEDQSRDSACVTYDVRFSAGFEVSAGGKLPGLLGVAPGVSPATPTGGGKTDHGWSGRVMWLGPKLFQFVRESGQPDLAVTYLYHPGQAGEFGDDVSWGRSVVDGSWHTLRQCYTLNTVGESDGRLRAWVDGDPVLDRADVVYRTDPAVHITHLDWSIFRGGDNDDWTASSGGDVDLDNLVVTVA